MTVSASGSDKAAAWNLVDQDAQFRAGIQRGAGQADRGELIDRDQVAARIEQLFQAK